MLKARLKVLKTHSDLLRCFYVRGVVFIEEQRSPYDAEFDYKDLNSFYFLGLLGREPVTTGRIRLLEKTLKYNDLQLGKSIARAALAPMC